jgi:hypothetical protein
MFHGHSDYFQNPPLGGRPNTKPRDYGILNAHNHWFILFYHVWKPGWIEIHWNSIWLRAHITYSFTLHLRIRDYTTWSWRCVGTAFGHFSFGLSQFHGHGSWLVCEVALARALNFDTTWSTLIDGFWVENLLTQKRGLGTTIYMLVVKLVGSKGLSVYQSRGRQKCADQKLSQCNFQQYRP